MRMSRQSAVILANVLLICLLSGCASWPRRFGKRPCCIDTKLTPTRQPIWWHLFDATILEPIEQPLHVVRFGRKLFGLPVRSINLQERRLTSSMFFTDRDPASLSAHEVRWGPSRPEDAGVAPFTITKSKMEGKTPGFFATDARGMRYLFKLDPPDAPELLSGAEVVTSKLLFALGYHVPSYEVALLRPDDLRVGAERAINETHKPRLLTKTELQSLLRPRLVNGTVRVSASKILDGEILGPARFKQFRDCAEVRALKVAYAWLNNIDAKDHNSLLVWNKTQTLGYIIDFGTSLGADAGLGGPKHPCAGWLNIVDLQEASLKLITLGWHRPVCDPQRRARDASVGLFSSHVNPDRWKPYAPNAAFQAMNREDAQWIARRLARLSREQIEAAVSAGKYSNPEDAAYLADMLEQRRRTIVNYYLKGENYK
jgi:hypothetical protein